MTRPIRTAALLAAVCAGVAAAPVAASAAGPDAKMSRTCKLSRSEQRGALGPTYALSLAVSRTSCSRGKSVIRSYHRCRYRNGGRDGRCTRAVLGWRCREARNQRIRTQFDASVSCRKGRARIAHRYTQFT